jgi:AmmeMemoRadiSam system protein B
VTAIRPPAAAGRFYPAQPERLRAAVRAYVDAATPVAGAAKALIVPHAGYRYSGPVAGAAYACVKGARGTVRRVVLLGTAHWTGVAGLAASGADGFATPLGVVPLDRPALKRVIGLPQVTIDDEAQELDHALEVQLPFLQVTLGDFALAPFLVGRSTPGEVAALLDVLWGGVETLVVVSSDLSHGHASEDARRLDRATAGAIEALRPDGVGPEQACGHRAIAGLLTAARRHGLRAATADLRNSGDTAGPSDAVVGYGAFVFVEPAGPSAARALR